MDAEEWISGEAGLSSSAASQASEQACRGILLYLSLMEDQLASVDS